MLRNQIYYRLKPFIPQAVRTAVRQRLAVRSRPSVENIWPIMPGSEHPPQNWPGWPDGKKFALVLTHDVESAIGLARCRELMKIEMDYGLRSSFNFVPEGGYRVSPKMRHELAQNGFEVGIHDLRHDGRLFQSRRSFARNGVRINKYLRDWNAAGFRSAFMLHNLDWLHDLDVKYDASTFDTDPFEPQPEGRHTIFPFWVPALHRQETGGESRRAGYVELPYTLPQDSTLFLLLGEKDIDIWRRKLDWIAEHGGLALLITHPDYISFSAEGPKKSGEYPIQLYRDFLEYALTKYAGQYWHPLPRELATFTSGVANCSNLEGTRSATRNSIDRLRAKRVAVLLFSYYPADPRPRRAAEAMAKEGVLVDLIALKKDPHEPRQEIINGVRVLRLPIQRRRAGRLRYVRQYTRFILQSFFCLGWRSLFRKYDLVHVHNMPDVLVFSALIPKLLGAKVVLDLHDPMPELMQAIFDLSEETLIVRLLKQLEKWSIRFADLIFTVNLACKRIYSFRGCPPEKIKVIINAPEDDVFGFQPPALRSTNGNGSRKPFVLLYHGSLVPRNGFDLAADALERARQVIPTAKLVVCGERSRFFDEVMGSIEKRGLHHSVEYGGQKNRTQIVEAINNCDLGIIPNHRNTFTEINTPTRIFEYLALGKPVIAPRTRGIRDYFEDEDLIFFEPGDVGDLARKIEFAFSHPYEVEKIVARGQQIYLAHQWTKQRLTLLESTAALL